MQIKQTRQLKTFKLEKLKVLRKNQQQQYKLKNSFILLAGFLASCSLYQAISNYRTTIVSGGVRNICGERRKARLLNRKS
jgi:hypothetical protein